MALRQAYAPAYPELDPFLYSAVGDEVDGVPLSVLSALARLGLDPRDEAIRLSHLTKDAAIDQLARLIAQLPERCWPMSEVQPIASRLIDLLPRGAVRSKPDKAPRVAKRKTRSPAPIFLIYAALAGAALISIISHGGLFSDGQGPSPAAPQTDAKPSPD